MLRSSDKDKKIQDKIKHDKIVVDYKVDELKYLKKPIGKALYKYSENEKLPLRKKNIPKWKEKVKCVVCGGMYMRSSKTRHEWTQRHKIYNNVNTKIVSLLTEGL